MKMLVFLGDALDRIRFFPEGARKEAGVQLHKVQQGLEPSAWKPMTTVGSGVREIRIREDGGAFRVLYITQVADAVVVLHAFEEEDAEDREARSGFGGREVAGMEIQGDETMTDKMEIQTFDSVWDAIEDTPQEAANMRLRSELMIAVEQEVRSWNLTQAKSSDRLGVTQPRLNDLLRGKIDKFSLDALVELSARAGLAVKLGVEKAA